MATDPSMFVDSGSGSCESEEIVTEPIVQINKAIAIIDSVCKFVINIDTVTWNKNQCERLAKRFNAVGDRFKSMGRNSDGGEASDGGPKYDELVKILKKGEALLSGYTSKEITSTVVSRIDNPDQFMELHVGLNNVHAEFGFQDLLEDVEWTSGPDQNPLERDASLDKQEVQTTAERMDQKSLAKVVSEKATDVDVERLVHRHVDSLDGSDPAEAPPLPSYLRINVPSDVEYDAVQRIRTYKPESDQDPKEQVGWVSVKSGTWLGCDFAFKVFECGFDEYRAEWNRRQLLMEAGSLVALQHPHVVRFVGFGRDDRQCVMVMELMEGDLRQLMKERMRSKPGHKPFTDIEEINIIEQIAKGMHFMHTRGFAHGDLKCSNILVKSFAEQEPEVKISDLRASQRLSSKGHWDPRAFVQASRTRRPRWTAPEAIDHYGDPRPSEMWLKRSDVYSFGMTCFEVVTGTYPFDGMREREELLRRIKDGPAEKWNLFPPELDKDLRGLITTCWRAKPSSRPDFISICRLLEGIKSNMYKKVAAEKSKSCVNQAGALLNLVCIKSLENVKEGVSRILSPNEAPAKVDYFRSKSLVEFPDHLDVPPDQLELFDRIGEGTHGTVYKASWLGCTCAVKILKCGSNTRDLQREVNFLVKVSRHPCIVQMVGLSVKSDPDENRQYLIVMEYMAGNLRTLIDKRRKSKKWPFTFSEAVLIITQLAWGMAYLHSKGLVHLDLNLRNVLAQDYSRTIDVKIVDFGISYLEDSDTSKPERFMFYSGQGSGFYRAPEMLPVDDDIEVRLPQELPARTATATLEQLKATDVFSFAIICYEVLTGNYLGSELKATNYAAVIEGYRPKWLLKHPPHPKLKSLVERCWCTDPTKRPTFIDICTDLKGLKNP